MNRFTLFNDVVVCIDFPSITREGMYPAAFNQSRERGTLVPTKRDGEEDVQFALLW